jgi:hypothetical protein
LFICVCDCVSHLDEFCFWHKRIKKRRLDYGRNSYRDVFFDFLSRSYSCASPRTSSHAFPLFSYGPNHRSYVLVHVRTALSLDTLVTVHALIVVIVSPVGLVFLQEGFTPVLSRDT